MQRTVWLFVGLLIGAGGMWAYATQVREPGIIAETTQAVKEMVEADRIASSNELRGTVVRVTESAHEQTGADTYTITIKNAATGTETSVIADTNTSVYQLAAESNSGQNLTNALFIKPGDELMVITNPSANENAIYANEITIL